MTCPVHSGGENEASFHSRTRAQQDVIQRERLAPNRMKWKISVYLGLSTSVSCFSKASGFLGGFSEDFNCSTVDWRAIGSVLGVHDFAPVLAFYGDFRWKTQNVRQKCEMIQLGTEM